MSPWRSAVRSLSNRNIRRYLTGQSLSVTGMWIQTVSELWLILTLTHSGTALGLHAFFRYGPTLLFGAPAGVVSDRFDRLKLLATTQTALMLCAGTFAVLVWVSTPTLFVIYALVLMQGLINAADNPVRSAFLRDLSNDDELPNAVGLNSSLSTMGRTVGPAIAGLLIAGVGVQWCFTLNAVSFGAVLVALASIDRSLLRPRETKERTPGQLREGVRYALAHPAIRRTLMFTGVVSIFSWQWAVVLPVFSTEEFGGNAELYGLFVSAFSLGSVIGALYTAHLHRPGGRHLRMSGGALAVALATCAVAPTLPVAFVALVMLGASGAAFISGAQSRLQLSVADHMSGRVIALWSVVFIGSKPIGGFIAGFIIDVAGSRASLGFSAVAAAVAVTVYALARRSRQEAGARESVGSAEA